MAARIHVAAGDARRGVDAVSADLASGAWERLP
jgi:hypothetical protein